MAQSHQRVDLPDRILFTDRGDMQIDHGGSEMLVSQILLDQLEVDTGFEQVRCVAVSEGMSGDLSLVPVQLSQYGFDRVLDRGFTHRAGCGRSELMISSFSGKQPSAIAMCGPEKTQFLI